MAEIYEEPQKDLLGKQKISKHWEKDLVPKYLSCYNSQDVKKMHDLG